MTTALAVQPKGNALAQLDKARQMLAESRTLPEVKKIRDIAEVAKVYAKAANLGRDAQNYAAEISIMAAGKAGEILKQLSRKQGERTDKLPASVAGGSEYSKTLEETGTAERTAQYWQKIADVPEESRSAYFARMQSADNGEITVAGLLRAAPHAEKRKNRSEPPDDFEVLRKLALRALNLGFAELKKTDADPSHLAAAKDWAQCRLMEREQPAIATTTSPEPPAAPSAAPMTVKELMNWWDVVLDKEWQNGQSSNGADIKPCDKRSPVYGLVYVSFDAMEPATAKKLVEQYRSIVTSKGSEA